MPKQIFLLEIESDRSTEYLLRELQNHFHQPNITVRSQQQLSEEASQKIDEAKQGLEERVNELIEQAENTGIIKGLRIAVEIIASRKRNENKNI